MERYVDGFVLPIPAENIEKYREIAQKAGEVWKEHGALEYWECVGDDLEIQDMLSFKTIAGAAEGETVVFAWIVYESRESRDKVNAAVMEDQRLKEMMGAPDAKIFDYKRMAYGGFKTLVKI
ncbi:MAG: DUF1428 domain-containing protein [Acidobacteriota bacterium]|nr:DUF1428 domain-containing protein [Acidobacteriota bacterium]